MFADSATNDNTKGITGGSSGIDQLPLGPPIHAPMPTNPPSGYQYYWVDNQGWVLYPIYSGVNPTYPPTHQPPISYGNPMPLTATTFSNFFTNNKPLVYLIVGIGALFMLGKK